jgi:hypothetical protein
MNYAQIANGSIQNVIVLEDDSLLDHFTQGFDFLIPLDELDPTPQIGWLYDGTNFTAPAPVVPPIVPLNTQVTAVEFGIKLMQMLAVYNVERGLTSAQRLQLAQALGPFAVMIQSGDLQGFVDVSVGIPVDGTLVTQELIDGFDNAITSYLAGDAAETVFAQLSQFST